jgi:D-psicose/D-tagatose/L-ribulose 3-epimerase
MPADLGLTTWNWVSPLTDDNLRETLERIRSYGYDRAELPFETLDGFDPESARRALEDLGLGATTVGAITEDRDILSDDPAIVARGTAYLMEAIDLAAEIGSPVMSGPIYSAVGRCWLQSPAERARDIDRLVRELDPIAAHASRRGVALGLEPLNRFETSFVNLVEQGVEIVDRVDNPALGLLLDTFHMNIEEKSIGDAIRAAGSRIVHVHACENDRGTPGSGHVPWAEVAGALRDIDYRGPIVIETFNPDIHTIARAVSIWRPFAPSPEALASEGIAFLRDLLG